MKKSLRLIDRHNPINLQSGSDSEDSKSKMEAYRPVKQVNSPHQWHSNDTKFPAFVYMGLKSSHEQHKLCDTEVCKYIY